MAQASSSACAPPPVLYQGTEWWLDSLDLFEAILACEEGFGVQIDAEANATAEALHTVQGLADLIRATRPGGPA
jgi:hypothetical protein